MGGAAAANTYCTVNTAMCTYRATNTKTSVDWSAQPPSFAALDFSPADPLYFEYHIRAGMAGCGQRPNRRNIYTFRANADLDGDMIESRFELAVGSNMDNELFRAPGIYVENELE